MERMNNLLPVPDPVKTVSLPVSIADSILDELYELRGERAWWKDEPRCNCQRDYQHLCDLIAELETVLHRGGQH